MVFVNFTHFQEKRGEENRKPGSRAPGAGSRKSENRKKSLSIPGVDTVLEVKGF